MAHHVITHETLAFLTDLKSNNNREWFQANKERYLAAHENMIAFTEALILQMDKHDHLVPRSPKQSLFRIYRDIRFSKDKRPYKTGFMGSMKRATKWLRGGYFFKIEPDGNTAIVALGRANHVAFVDVASREIEDYVLVGNRAWNTTLSRDNATLYVANGLSDDVSVIDVGERKTVKSIPIGRVPHTVLIDD